MPNYFVAMLVKLMIRLKVLSINDPLFALRNHVCNCDTSPLVMLDKEQFIFSLCFTVQIIYILAW
jgi:hypothetical protein